MFFAPLCVMVLIALSSAPVRILGMSTNPRAGVDVSTRLHSVQLSMPPSVPTTALGIVVGCSRARPSAGFGDGPLAVVYSSSPQSTADSNVADSAPSATFQIKALGVTSFAPCRQPSRRRSQRLRRCRFGAPAARSSARLLAHPSHGRSHTTNADGVPAPPPPGGDPPRTPLCVALGDGFDPASLEPLQIVGRLTQWPTLRDLASSEPLRRVRTPSGELQIRAPSMATVESSGEPRTGASCMAVVDYSSSPSTTDSSVADSAPSETCQSKILGVASFVPWCQPSTDATTMSSVACLGWPMAASISVASFGYTMSHTMLHGG